MGPWSKNWGDTSLEKEMERLDELDEEIENCPLMQAGREDAEYKAYRQSVTPATEPGNALLQPASSAKGNSRAKRLHHLADQAVADNKLYITKEGIVFTYQEEQGCFRPVTNPKAYLANQFPEEITAGLLASDITEIVERVSWKEGVICSLDDFNSCSTKVNLKNGVLDMETMQLQPHDPCYRFTYCIDAKYIEDSEEISCPEFDQFCKTSLDGDPKKLLLLLEFISYACLDTNAGKCAMFLKGQPNSGKSVVIGFISHLFDDELVAHVPLHQLGDRFFRAELAGKKLNTAGEMAGKALHDISIFKSVTGNDRIAGEFKGEKPFYFLPRCKLLFSGNTLPQMKDTDATAAFVNRLKVLLFNTSIDPKDQDKSLPEKLWAERDSIVTLALQAAKQLAERNFEFTQPEDSKQFLASYELRGNVLGQFLEECCILAPEGRVFNKDLYPAYRAFCEENGWKPKSRQVLYELLSGVPGVFADRFRIGKENRQGHKGISLKNANTSGTLEQKS